MYVPANKMVRMTMSWYIECPTMFFIIVREMSGLVRPYGLRLSNSSLGNSVANASDARVSIIRFTQSICIAFNGESCSRKANGRKVFTIHRHIWCILPVMCEIQSLGALKKACGAPYYLKIIS